MQLLREPVAVYKSSSNDTFCTVYGKSNIFVVVNTERVENPAISPDMESIQCPRENVHCIVLEGLRVLCSIIATRLLRT